MAGEWRQVSLGELIEIRHGFAFGGEYFRDEPPGDVLLTPGNFAIGGGFKGDKLKFYNGPVPGEFILRECDLLVTMTDLSKDADTLGYPAFVPHSAAGRRFLHNQRLGKIDIKPGAPLERRFLYYLLCSQDYRNEIIASATGSTVKHTAPSRINSFRFNLPPREEQLSVARILGAFDDKIDLNRRMNETLETMARALFKSWFVDFDPVRAKAEGRDPGLPKSIADVFPSSLVGSELGEIPEGWEVAAFGDVVDQLRDQENPLVSPEATFLHFSIPAFDEGQNAKVELGENIKSIKTRVPAGAILLSKLNPEIERVWLVDVVNSDRAICSTEFLVLRPRAPFSRAYAYCLTRSSLFRQQIESLVTGTSKSHQRAHAETILCLAAVRPPSAIVGAFENAADHLLDRTLECRRECRTLAALRDALLPKLISGEIRVKQAEKLVEAVV